MFIFIVCIVILYVLLQFIRLKFEKRARRFFSYGGFPLIFAHRGASLLFPENTQLAFEKSFEMGIDGFETDIRLTKDGYIITQHDENISRTTEFSGKVIDYTYDEIKEFNFGYKFKNLNNDMPYLEKQKGLHPMKVEDLFEKFKDKVLYSIDIKDKGVVGKKSASILYNLVKKYKLEKNVIFASFHDEISDYLREISSNDIIISGSKKKATSIVLSMYFGIDEFLKYRTSGLQIPNAYKNIKLSTKYLIYKLHKHKMFCHFWTINDEKEMKELIDKKVDAITTDRIDLLLKLKKEYLS